MTDAITAAVEQARIAAANMMNQAETGLPQLYAPVSRIAQPLTVDDMLIGDLRVDNWLKVKEYGLFIDSDRTPFHAFSLEIDLSEVQYSQAIKFGKNPVTYLKTYDFLTCVQGGSWNAALDRALQADPMARPYKSADLVFVAPEDIRTGNGTVIAGAGNRIGHSLSTTGWSNWSSFVSSLRKSGFNPGAGRHLLTVGFEVRKKGTNEWGVPTFHQHASTV